MIDQEEKEAIQKKIADLKEWEKILPEGESFQELLQKFESLLEG